MDSIAPPDSAPPPPGWRERLLTPGTVLRAVLLALLAYPAVDTVLHPLGRGQRSVGLATVCVPLALFVVVLLSLLRHLLPAGPLARRGRYGFAVLAVVVGTLSCAVPIPAFYWGVVDTLANERELALVREGLLPLVESIRDETRRAGRPPEDLAPLLERQDARTLGFLGVREPIRVGRLRYFSGPDRFALAAVGTPRHRDSLAVIVHTPWDDRWEWRDMQYRDQGDHRDWLGAQGQGLQEWECLTASADGRSWRCTRYPPEPPP